MKDRKVSSAIKLGMTKLKGNKMDNTIRCIKCDSGTGYKRIDAIMEAGSIDYELRIAIKKANYRTTIITKGFGIVEISNERLGVDNIRFPVLIIDVYTVEEFKQRQEDSVRLLQLVDWSRSKWEEWRKEQC